MTVATLDISPSGAWRYWLRNAVVFKRTWLLGLMAWFIEPVIYLVAMGIGLGKYLQQVEGLKYIVFIAPGLLAVSAMYGATFETTWNSWYKMAEARVYDACVATPLSVEDVALGEALWGTTRAAAYGTAFAIVAVPFGVFRSWWGILTVPALFLVGLNFALFGLTYTYLIKRVDYLSYYWTIFLTPMFMFAGVFFPLDQLPHWLRDIAWFMPLHHGTELMRALMTEGDPGKALGSALWLIVTSAIFLLIPPYVLKRRLVK
ncbi:MAG: ABC transporter permease [Actinomycetota bacterium]